MYFYNFWYTTRSYIRLFFRLLFKAVLTTVFIPFLVFLAFFKAFSWLYRLVAVYISALVAVIALYFCFTKDFSGDFVMVLAGCGMAIGLHFLLPVVVSLLDDLKYSMKTLIQTPVIVRSPVKYTL